jgi:hypothetical protein
LISFRGWLDKTILDRKNGVILDRIFAVEYLLVIIRVMAFLVCYSRSAPGDHARQKAIYLDLKFYEMIFRHCIAERSFYAILGAVASLRYKSPLLVIAEDRLDSLADELTHLETSGHSHPQIAEFRKVCAKAKADGCSLSISGDMYPEL